MFINKNIKNKSKKQHKKQYFDDPNPCFCVCFCICFYFKIPTQFCFKKQLFKAQYCLLEIVKIEKLKTWFFKMLIIELWANISTTPTKSLQDMIYRLNFLANLLNQCSYTGSQFHSCGCKAKKQTMYGCFISKILW